MLSRKRLVDVEAKTRLNQQDNTKHRANARIQEFHQQAHMKANISQDQYPELEQRWRQAAQMLDDDHDDDYLSSGRRSKSPSRMHDQGPDDSSSISFAQSGCHSILSAWRLKSAGRASRSSQRATSVLSATSGASKLVPRTPSQGRIPLGPRGAQHFVTNSRRRRQANELIMSTLEARRRAIEIGRQNTASLFGSASYLAGYDGSQLADPMLEDYAVNRLSLSPSPVTRKTPSPAPRRSTLSDLGARSPSAAQVQRQRLLMSASQPPKRPPLAKLDQNSSDLNSSNSSSGSESDSSSGSQFTQLVTSELTPQCDLLDKLVLGSMRPRPVTYKDLQPPPPRAPERSRRKQQKTVTSVARETNEITDKGNKLRRGCLRRDSIRRLRMNRQPVEASRPSDSDAVPSSSDSSNSAAPQLKPLPITRKLDIESNPFLNRHHFRSSSVRNTREHQPRVFSLATKRPPGPHGAERTESAIRSGPAATVVPPRARSSEAPSAARRNIESSNKAAKQEELGVRQVERMLRQMEPNQVFSSQVNETKSTRNKSMESNVEPPTVKMIRTSGLMSSRPSTESRSSNLVKEGTKSHNNLTFDVAGNRRQHQVEEHWHHQNLHISTPDGSSTKSQKLVSEKLDLLRSTSISPPAQFADPKPKMAVRSHPLTNNSVSSSQRPFSYEPYRRSLSEERPKVVPRPREHQAIPPGRNELDKLEPVTKDSFEKRMEYLMQLARSNLVSENDKNTEQAKPPTPTKPTAFRKPQPAPTRVSPKIGANSPTSVMDERAKWNFRTPSNKIKGEEQNVDRKMVTVSDLDSMTTTNSRSPLSSVDNRPLAGIRWQRSNSSLASLGRAQTQPGSRDIHVVTRQLSPELGSRPSAGQPEANKVRELTSSAVVKLVVREKSAPKLDHAIVEQQPPVQHARFEQPRPLTALKPNRPIRTPPGPLRPRSPVRGTSPRSPDLGVLTNSSNDDSAIASSVSSPSLSFMTSADQSRSTGVPPLAQVGSPIEHRNTISTPARVRPSLAQPETATTGTLQSILRRHQEQQSGESSDNSVSNQPNPLKKDQLTSPMSPQIKPETSREASLNRAESSISRPLSPSQSSPQASSATKRVHFNDRTSIRSFESISSLASDSTAVPNEMTRQQVGSPDSMGSGSTSRLSAESPDLRKGSGAAIYAIRGDPELEQAMMDIRPPQPYRDQPLASTASYPMMVQSTPIKQSQQQCLPYIRMTAPPTITTNTIQYASRPMPLQSVSNRENIPREPHQPDDDEDPNYALRLRQAATNRVFNYSALNPMTALPHPQQPNPRRSLPVDLNFQTEV